jgi:hypothetical protein
MKAWFDKKQRLAEASAEAERQKRNPASALVSVLSPAHN